MNDERLNCDQKILLSKEMLTI